MKKFISFFLLALILSVASCTTKQAQYAVDVALINNDILIIQNRYNALVDLTRAKWDLLEADEQTNLKAIDTNVSLIMDRVDTIRSLRAYEVSIADMGYMYTLAKNSYVMGKEIVIAHEKDLTMSEKITMEMFDEQLKELDTKVKKLIENPDNKEINMTLISILTITGATLKLLLPIAMGM